MWRTLPAELKALVVADLASRLDFDALSSLSRLSREWLDIALDGLYKSFVFHDTLHDIDVLHRFVLTLAKNPALAARVQHVDVSIRQEDRSGYQRLETTQSMRPLIKLITDIKRSHCDKGALDVLRNEHRSVILAALLTQLPNVQRLVIGLPKCSTQAYLAKVIEWLAKGGVGLQTRSLQRLDEIHVWPCEPTFCPPERNDWIVRGPLAKDVLAFRSLKRASFLNLDVQGPISLGSTHISPLKDVHFGDRLEHLALDYQTDNFSHDTIVSIIKGCTGLVSLRFAATDGVTSTSFRQRLGQAIAQSKRTLQRMILHLPPVQFESPSSSIISFHDFTSLTYLAVEGLALFNTAHEESRLLPEVLPPRLEELHLLVTLGADLHHYRIPVKGLDITKHFDAFLVAKGAGKFPRLHTISDSCEPPLSFLAKRWGCWDERWEQAGLGNEPEGSLRLLMQRGSTDEVFCDAMETIQQDWHNLTCDGLMGSDESDVDEEDEEDPFDCDGDDNDDEDREDAEVDDAENFEADDGAYVWHDTETSARARTSTILTDRSLESQQQTRINTAR